MAPSRVEGESAALLRDVEGGGSGEERAYGTLPAGEREPPSPSLPRRLALLLSLLVVSLLAAGALALGPRLLSFSAAGPDLWPVRFLNVGDWGRGGAYNQSLIADQMGLVGARLSSQFVVSNGDNFYEDGLKGAADPFFSESFTRIYTAASLQTPWYTVLGNHDYYGDVLSQLNVELVNRDPRWLCQRSGRLAKSLCAPNENLCSNSDIVELFFFDTVPMVKSYRSLVSENGVHKVDWRGINTSDWEGYNRQQVKELEDALASSAATWKIVVGHHPLYSYGTHGDQQELIDQVKPVLEKAGVDVWLNGHDHNMQHIKRDDSSVHYVTSGGGSKAFKSTRMEPSGNYGLQFWWPGQGFAAVQVSRRKLRITFHGLAGEMYRFTLTK